MKLLLLMSLLIYSSIQTAQTGIFSQSETEGSNITLACGNEGKVVWSKGADRGTSAILTAEDGEITQRLRPDPENRYSVLTDLSLVIRSVSLSDSGIYYCNAAPAVNLTVNPAPQADAPTTNSTAQSSSGSDDLSSSTAPPGVTCCSSVSSSKTHRARNRMIELPTPALKSTKASEKKTQSTQTEQEWSASKSTKASEKKTQSTQTEQEWSASNYLITIAVLVGVLLIILALFLQRRYFKRKAARATKTDHVYETINDAVLTTQPASSPPKEYEAIYVLAGDPDVIKLGLNNQSAASPLKPQAQSTENNPSEPLYSSIQELSR